MFAVLFFYLQEDDMPYASIAELPPAVKSLPAHAKEIYMKAFNGAFEQYKDRGDQREALSHATAWAAVEKVYKKEGDRWVAKEAKVLSDKSKKSLLQKALVTEYGLAEESPIPKNIQIDEIFENELAYNVDGQFYKVSYELIEGEIKFGDPVKVMAETTYKPMESLRETYSEIIQEAGKRNAVLDSARIKKIVELCQELLSSEEPEEKKTKEALKEATSVLTWLKEQAAVKTEEGVKYPAEAFAYVKDAEKPSDWKLRMWEDLDKKVTKAQLGRVAAALSPGGFRGQKVAIPTAELDVVKRKIRAAYRKLGVQEDEMPRWVKEAETREEVLDYMPLTEATFDKGRAQVIVIKAGFNANKSRYYPKEMLQRDYGIFEGLKMYADHPTESDERERPERSIRDWVATLSEVKCDENGTVTGIANILEPWLMTKLASLRDKEMLSEMGISINAVGHATKATIEGVATLAIEELERAVSVDFVTEPGAGGIVTLYEADRERNVDLVELATLKERRPDLIKALTAEVRTEILKEAKRMSEQEERITELEGQITTLTTERDGLKEAAEIATKEKAKAEAQATIKEAVDKAELPVAAKERLTERFKDAESADGIAEAIQSEVDYIAKLSEAGKVKGLGESKSNPVKDKEALKESFKKMHPEWTDAQLETAVTGR